jgi:hypothetical protein
MISSAHSKVKTKSPALKEALFFEAEIAVVTDDQMIQESDPEQFPCPTQVPGHGNIFIAG